MSLGQTLEPQVTGGSCGGFQGRWPMRYFDTRFRARCDPSRKQSTSSNPASSDDVVKKLSLSLLCFFRLSGGEARPQRQQPYSLAGAGSDLVKTGSQLSWRNMPPTQPKSKELPQDFEEQEERRKETKWIAADLRKPIFKDGGHGSSTSKEISQPVV